MITIAICDDEINIANDLESQITQILGNDCKHEIDVYITPSRLMKAFTSKIYDILFLDIEIKTENGIDIGRYLRNIVENHYSSIIFFSSHVGYHEQLFEVTPSGFLQKPIDKLKLENILTSTISRINKRRKTDSSFFSYKKFGELAIINITDILYFESIKREMKIIYTKDNQVFSDMFYKSISDTLDKLGGNLFSQIHRSYIVNLGAVKKAGKSSVTIQNDIELPISKKYYHSFVKTLSDFYLN